MAPLRPDFVIKDPIYGYFELTELEKAIIETSLFQRLRFITQNGLAFYTYPSLRGSRFEHSIGVAHLAGQVIQSVFSHTDGAILAEALDLFWREVKPLVKREEWQDLASVLDLPTELDTPFPLCDKATTFVCQLFRVLGLLHDIGHLPFSHLGEDALAEFAEQILGTEDWNEFNRLEPRPKLHEYLSFKLILLPGSELEKAFEENPWLLTVLRGIYRAKLRGKLGPALRNLYELIDSDVDVDRGDYLRRDGYNSGIGFGEYDIERLINSVALIEIRRDDGSKEYIFAPSDSSISTVETFLVERYKLYKWLYFHHSIRYFNHCLTQALRFLVEIQREVEGFLKDKFRIEYFHYRRFVYQDGFICNEIWLWDVFYKALIDLASHAEVADLAPGLRAKLLQALTYLEVIVKRAKSGFTVWKTHPEYLLVNRGLKGVILAISPSSDSATPPRFMVGDLNLAEVSEQELLNSLLAELSGDKLDKFHQTFQRTGIPISYGNVKGFYQVEGLEDREPVGHIFVSVCDFKPFKISGLAKNSRDPLSQFEFRLRRPSGGNRIRLTEVSQLVASLPDAWRSDIQVFLYFQVSRLAFRSVVASSQRGGHREKLTILARETFVQSFVGWLRSEGLLKVVT